MRRYSGPIICTLTLVAITACGPAPALKAVPSPFDEAPGSRVRLRADPARPVPTREQAISICRSFDLVDRQDCLETVRQLYPQVIAAAAPPTGDAA